MRILHNLKISQKLFLLIIISTLCLGIVGFSGYKYMRDMAKSSNIMYDNHLQPLDWLGNVRTNNRSIDSYTLELMLTKDPVKNQELMTSIDEAVTQNNTMLEKFSKLHLSAEGEEGLEQYKIKVIQYSDARKVALDLAARNENEKAYQQYTNVVTEKRKEVNNIVTGLQKSSLDFAKKIDQDNNKKLKTASTILITIILIGVAISVLIGLVITKIIVNPVNQMKLLMSKAEEGDFTAKADYHSKDEIGQLMESFNNMITGLRAIISTVSETSELVAASSEELSASAEQSTKATEHISSTIQELAAGSEHQMHSSAETVEMSIEGKKSLNKVMLQMNSINESVMGLGNSIKGLSDRSTEIGRINEVITAIAAQTNLLALNAAIEAARAAEHGKGFAVVADEVRKLAEQSANSAEQITNLIQMIQHETNQTLRSMDSATKEVEAGLAVVEEAGASFDEIATSINTVKNIAEESAASNQNVSAATEEQLASMEEIQTSSSTLANMSEDLQNLIRKFKI
ncbi:methyl-accepting chemotaxis protein [Metabacillus fastidiosus]|uniref:methyl-accepting chemotaxis protein n=1 Tax=Metabacillus fastidiosus TaxID=1458 RepID=UPI003D2A5703